MAVEQEYGGLFPPCSLEDWREAVFQLCWQQDGGSGVSMAYADVLGMAVVERDWWLRRIARQREDEAQAIAQAARG